MEKRETNHTNTVTKGSSDPIKLNDIGFRLILIPVFGIIIPIVTDLLIIQNIRSGKPS
ncbi:MAG: hypothetical protein WDN26_05680 [Chitinophagaceae bacterium]